MGIYTVGTEKKRSLSESRGDHLGGGQNQQKSLGGTGGCSVRQGDHFGGVLLYLFFFFRQKYFLIV
jgi:hypothetical protein